MSFDVIIEAHFLGYFFVFAMIMVNFGKFSIDKQDRRYFLNSQITIQITIQITKTSLIITAEWLGFLSVFSE